MPIKSISNVAIPRDEYDKVAANLEGPIRAADGFLFHIAESAPDGIRVTEVWASREQAQRFYDTAVRPNLPPRRARANDDRTAPRDRARRHRNSQHSTHRMTLIASKTRPPKDAET
jgi:hypothetical protein